MLPVSAPRYSEALFKTVFEQSPQAIVLVRLSDNVLVEVNDEWLRLTGFSRAEVLGRTAVQIGHWLDPAEREEALTPLRAGGRVVDADVTMVMKDRKPRQVRMNAAVVNAQGESYILFYLRDITAERLTRDALHAGEQELARINEKLNRQIKLHQLTESLVKVGYWVIYPGDPTVHLSSGYAQIAQLGDVRVVPRGVHLEHVVEEDRERVIQSMRDLDGQVQEYRWRQPDGNVIWVRARSHREIENGVLKASFGIVQEITAEKEASRALSDQLAFIQKITSRAPGMVYEFQMWPDGRIGFPFVSSTVEALFGVSEADLRQDPTRLFSQIDRTDLDRLRQRFADATRDMTAWQCELRARTPLGMERWLLASALPEQQPDGSVLWCGSVADISVQKEALARAQQSEARFRSLTDLSSDWYWEQDENLRFVRIDRNALATEILPTESNIGKTRWEIGAMGVSEADWAAHRAALQAHETFSDFEMQRLRKDGTVMWVSISGTPIFDERGVFKGYRGTGRDISARKQAEAEIERLAFYDALTALPNRRLLLDRLTKAVASSTRLLRHGALLFIDLDNFKVLNDTLGHHMGDELLKQVAKRLLHCVRSCDTVARLGGDEFVVMLEDLDEDAALAANQTELVGRKILASLNLHYVMGGQEYHSSPSIGVTLFFKDEHSVDELLQRADLAMYQSKAAGRNTVRFFDPTMQAAASERASLEADMRLALLRQEFALHYQPVVNEHGYMTGVEALLRWHHPKRGLVSPVKFIPVAEQTGLILPLGQWVLEAACKQMVAWAGNAKTQALSMAVNVSARQFRHPDFASQLLLLLKSTGANPHRLKLELTESLLLSDIEDAIAKMGQLRAIGVGFALDDFGTGYSSLSYLKLLPLDQLKIDQSFVRDVLLDPNDAAIARTILNLAESLELGVVAEGVENEGQRDCLLRMGCKAFQGYYFGKPVPVDQLQMEGPLKAAP